MKRTLPSAFAIIALVLLAHPAFAISFSSIFGDSRGEPKFNLIHVQDLARLMKDPSAHVYIFDANPPDVRASTGIIPGARLLASYKYDVATELPPDKNAKLVFYCHNVH